MCRLKLPPIETREARSLTSEEIRTLREVCRGDWTFVLVELALASGARRGELLCAAMVRLDWATKYLLVTKSLEQTAAGLRVKPRKAKSHVGSACRRAPSPRCSFIENSRCNIASFFGADYHDLGLIFTEPNGDYLQPDLIS